MPLKPVHAAVPKSALTDGILTNLLELGKKGPSSPENRKIPSELIAYFGFQSANDLLIFLNSPKGKITLAIIEQRIAEMVDILEKLKLSHQLAQMKKVERLVFLLLALLCEWEEQEQFIMQNAQLFLEKQQAEAKRLSAEANKEASKPLVLPFGPEITEVYQEAISVLEEELNNKIQASATLENKIRNHEMTSHMADEMYETCILFLTDSTAKILRLLESNGGIKYRLPSIIDSIHNEIQSIQSALALGARDIAEDLNKSEPNTQQQLGISTASQLQLTFFTSVISWLKNEKYSYDKKGERTEDFEKAYYLVPEDKKIVRINDELYLFPARETNIENLSHEQLKKARHAFLHLEPQMLMVMPLVNQNRDAQVNAFRLQSSLYYTESSRLQSEMLHLGEKLRQANQTTTAARNCIQQSTIKPSPILAPSPATPTPGPTPKPSPRPANKLISESHLAILRLLSHDPTKTSIMALRQVAPLEAKTKLQQLKPNQPLSPDELDTLEKAFHPSPSPFKKYKSSR